MATENILFKHDYAVNQYISIHIPTVEEILDDEDNYYGIVSTLTAMPVDMMVQLDDIGIDFSTIDEWDLFLLLFTGLREADTKLIFGDLDLSKFNIAINKENGNVVVRDEENNITIDRAIHARIASVLRKIHHLEKNRKKPGNDAAKSFMLERARRKLKRQKRMKKTSELESLIIAMVNTEQFKYDFDSVRQLTIYQFNESVRQIINKVEYDNRMIGVYTGNINAKELSQDELNWLVHK